MPTTPTYPYPLPTATLEHVTRMQTLYAQHYGATLSEKDAKELLETLMRLVYLTQLHQLNALHDALHPLC